MRTIKRTVFAGMIIAVALLAHAAHAATLSLVSDVTSASIGDTVNVSVRIDSQGQTVNAVQGTIDYPTSILQIARVDRTNSVFNIWAQEPSVNTSTGEITFLGGGTNSFSGSSLYVLNITFTVHGTGLATLDFKDAGVTAGDGTGGNILSGSTGLSIRVGGSTAVAPVVASSSIIAPPPAPVQIKRPAVATTTVPVAPALSVNLYPDQSAWYGTVGNFLVQWQLPVDVTDIATAVDQNPQTVPTVSEGLFNNKTFGALKEGVWYLHVRFKNLAGWSPVTSYKISIDTTPPFPFSAKMKDGATTEIVAPTVQFSTQDQPSGVAYYQILSDGVAVGSTTDTSFMVPALSFGSHNIVVQAVDHAGNVTESRVAVTIVQPAFFTIGGVKITEAIFFETIIVVIIIGILIGWWIGRREKAQRKNRIIIAGRDVSVGFGMVEKNIDEMLSSSASGSGESQMADIKFLLQETKGEIEKMKRYVSENVEEIER